MVRTDGEFYDFTPISKSEYDKMLAIIKQVSEELQPLFVVKRQIDAKICTAHKEIWKIADGSKVFFTSDTHFNHTNILKFCDRPFKNVEEMNETMIANWNCIVGMDDDVFHLGDFCLGGAAEWTKMTSGNSLVTSTPARTTPE